MGIYWKPDRLANKTDPQQAEFGKQQGAAEKEREEVMAHEGGPIPEERGMTTHWREDVPVNTFVAALREMADALEREQDFSFAVGSRFMVMRPTGSPSIEYDERANQYKRVIFRYSWEA